MKKSEIFGKSSKILENSQNFNISDFQKSKKYFQQSFFEKTAKKYPEAIAIDDHGKQITYDSVSYTHLRAHET